jgi:hypothetical protein
VGLNLEYNILIVILYYSVLDFITSCVILSFRCSQHTFSDIHTFIYTCSGRLPIQSKLTFLDGRLRLR